jgi:hypothetical protein
VHYDLSKDGTDLSVDMVQHTTDLDITPTLWETENS